MTTRPAPAGDTAPRYTSYPTAPHFHAGVNEAIVSGWLDAIPDGDALSLYLHIPFCDRLCWFCACHTKQTRRYEPVAAFLDVLHGEIDVVASKIAARTIVRAVHFGGGSPTMLAPDDFVSLAAHLRSAFRFEAGASFSVEIDPNDIDEAKLDALAAAGLTRASLGVQDFEPGVQQAINRDQSFEVTRDVVDGLRRRGVASLNLDLLYGLPHQTLQTLQRTVELSLSLQPDRIALFGYAHVPWFKKHQTMIDEAWLPDADARLEQSRAAARMIAAAGYVPIGIDHFARPDDSLAVALAEGRMRRNFQGYTDDGCQTLIGLGPSSVSRYRQGYAQNAVAMGDYVRHVETGRVPVVRGIELTDEDRIRGWIIERLMCDFGFAVPDVPTSAGPQRAALLREVADYARQCPDRLSAGPGRFDIPPAAQPYVRAIAAQFDFYFKQGAARHSAAV
jgi:oxygen-independent coproporphyrinogen-3 oxidase